MKHPLEVPHTACAFCDAWSNIDDFMTIKQKSYLCNVSMHVTSYAKMPARAHLGFAFVYPNLLPNMVNSAGVTSRICFWSRVLADVYFHMLSIDFSIRCHK